MLLTGNLPLFFAASAIGLATFLSIGLFIATLAGNLQQALLLCFFLLFSLMFLSGRLVPIESQPLLIQWVIVAKPDTVFHGDRTGHLAQGRWQGCTLAAVHGACRDWRCAERTEHYQVTKATLSCRRLA